jgi:hypothetical protein
LQQNTTIRKLGSTVAILPIGATTRNHAVIDFGQLLFIAYLSFQWYSCFAGLCYFLLLPKENKTQPVLS